MSIWVLIVSILVFVLSLQAQKSMFLTTKGMQEKFELNYDKGVKQVGEDAFKSALIIFSILHTVLYVIFYVITFNFFKSTEIALGFVAVFFLLESIYNMVKGWKILSEKKVKSSVVMKSLNLIELIYIAYFTYCYVASFM
jgi:hypothetical protein